MEHGLNANPESRPVKQKLRICSSERKEAALEEINKLKTQVL